MHCDQNFFYLKKCRAFSFWIEGIAVTLVSIFGIVGKLNFSSRLITLSDKIQCVCLQQKLNFVLQVLYQDLIFIKIQHLCFIEGFDNSFL